MQTYDVTKHHRELYAPEPGDFAVVDVPERGFLMVDGRGDPNTASAYRDAVEALYTASHAVRGLSKTTLETVHTVGPLEGLWSAEDLAVFRTRTGAPGAGR